ncbi:magnesium-dependent phosphatase 1-like [Trichogramma pretiosum]|uniref:magnesium-dependent phosphatase 1-like n=1 Tax=Trichogramma pretiosum TaxID=7493 RepID=UPI0006C93D8F|nr:magnesium-dependent phosphatase 1-like [Trichogramma pretiosum]XP_023315647.1 magnesium-dependent phosphatase 1-like [Trichogramma pretiosum]
MSQSSKKPKVVVFDLDYTLWPFWVDTHVTPPFKKTSNKIVDTQGQTVKHYPDSPGILKKLHEDGYEIGIASRTSETKGANQLLELFGWNKYIKYKEIYPGTKTTHFSKIKKASGVDYKDMIFFDDEQRNITDLTKLGVLSILVRDGVTHKVIQDALTQFAS